MSDYCNCCPTNTEHIRQHYDPGKVTQPDDDAEAVLATFRGCFPGECNLTLAEVEDYLEALANDERDEG
jgi:hypothetical protein